MPQDGISNEDNDWGQTGCLSNGGGFFSVKVLE